MKFIYFRPKLLLILLLGILSGLPLSLTASNLSAMLVDYDINIQTIGFISTLALPYSFKYLWAPILDNYKPSIPFLISKKTIDNLGKRRAWLLIVQPILGITIFALSNINPHEYMSLLMICGFLVTFLAATQDILIDAFRIEILSDDEQGAGSANSVLGYRLGMLISGAGGLYISSFLSWKIAYLGFGLAISILGIIINILSAIYFPNKCFEVKAQDYDIKYSLAASFYRPLQDMIAKAHWKLIFLTIMLYKLGDAYLGAMTYPFLADIGYSKLELATSVKLFGTFATFLGMFIGGYLISRFSIIFNLILGSILQALSNAIFIIQYYVGHNILVLAIINSIENIAGGIGSVALVALISKLCNKEFTASQFAVLSSISVLGRTLFSSSSGTIAYKLGWVKFIAFSTILSIPSIICLFFLVRYKVMKNLSNTI